MNEFTEAMKMHLFPIRDYWTTNFPHIHNGGRYCSFCKKHQGKKPGSRRSSQAQVLSDVFREWLLVAFGIQLAADIVETGISPPNTHLIHLGAVALIRTFLNYFLNKELNEQVKYSRTYTQRPEEKIA